MCTVAEKVLSLYRPRPRRQVDDGKLFIIITRFVLDVRIIILHATHIIIPSRGVANGHSGGQISARVGRCVLPSLCLPSMLTCRFIQPFTSATSASWPSNTTPHNFLWNLPVIQHHVQLNHHVRGRRGLHPPHPCVSARVQKICDWNTELLGWIIKPHLSQTLCATPEDNSARGSTTTLPFLLMELCRCPMVQCRVYTLPPR